MAKSLKTHAQKKRVLYILMEYPQLSQTYISNEISALQDDYEIEVATMREGSTPTPAGAPYLVSSTLSEVVAKVKSFKPHVLHGHWTSTIPLMDLLSRKTGVPYTVRAHSFDTLMDGKRANLLDMVKNHIRARYRYSAISATDLVKFTAPYMRRDNCLGVLNFPFSRQRLLEHGAPEEKLHDVFPVVNFDRFYNRDPNGDGVMNIGACIPKKRVEDFIDLASMEVGRPFRLYPIGYETERIRDYNISKGDPVEFMPLKRPEEMPGEYKRHQWLVYTGLVDRKSHLGWSMAVAEAQASGVGVCYPNIRDDLADYVGGAGYIYNSIDEVREIVSEPVPDDIREKGFSQAKKSDINVHKKNLTDIWATA